MALTLFKNFLQENDLDFNLVEAKQATETVEEAARVHNVPACNIVKSLLIKADEEFVVVLCPGNKRLDFTRLQEKLNSKNISMATATEVKKVTGHSINNSL